MNKKKTALIIFLSFAGIWILLDVFFFICFNNRRISYIQLQNYMATGVQGEVTYHLQELNIPKNSDAIINGEIRFEGHSRIVSYLLVYQNEYLKEDFLITSNQNYDNETRCYWAAKISNNEVTEAWYSIRPLSEKDIRPLSFDEQKEQFKFATILTNPKRFLRAKGWYSSEELIGYSNRIFENQLNTPSKPVSESEASN